MDFAASVPSVVDEKTTELLLGGVKLRNYKSIGRCDVTLRPLTILVGRNGSGKSNFLDALRFVLDSLQTSVDHAIKSRGGIEQVRRRSTGHPRNLAIELTIHLPGWRTANYGFEIAARQNGGFSVKSEYLKVREPGAIELASYRLEDGIIRSSSIDKMPPASADRLYLVNAAGLPQFRAVYDALTSMGFYNLNPEEMKELQSPDAGELLHRDGSNIPSVLARLQSVHPGLAGRINTYLSTIVPGISDVERVSLGPRETLEFRQRVVGAKHPWKFYAASMSDGTLRTLGVLVAAFQLADPTTPIRLVGLEEPETALHPAAAGALMDALREASAQTQILITSHSPDLLDRIDPEPEKMLIVQSQDGDTQIAPADSASLRAIREHLYSPGDLLRMDQLEPDRADLQRQEQLQMFDGAETCE